MKISLDVLHPNPFITQSARCIESVFRLQGKVISSDPISEMKLVQYEDKHYFVKLYYQAGKHLRRFVGRSRARAEHDNFKVFQDEAIPTPRVIAFGEAKNILGKKSFVITEGLTDVVSLQELQHAQPDLLKDKTWLLQIMQQVALYTQRLHQRRFVHVDLKWRNILVHVDTKRIYFIDCPQGHFPRLQLGRGIIKDLACLDKVAKYALTRTQRLKFYYFYQGIQRLTPKHKQHIRKILAFFEGRE